MAPNSAVRALAPASLDEVGVPVRREDEDVLARVLPHLAGATSHPQVVSCQRRSMRAARHVNGAPAPSALASDLQDTTV